MDWRPLAEKRAALGARLLDGRLGPLWVDRLDKPVSMASFRKCVFGQLYGSYSAGIAAFSLSEAEGLELGFRAGREDLGLNMAAFNAYYKALTRAWIKEIEKRRKGHPQ